jgi:hypothetical protein
MQVIPAIKNGGTPLVERICNRATGGKIEPLKNVYPKVVVKNMFRGTICVPPTVVVGA